ncbi:hypothetical protein GQX74_014681, partial [Glossina fuscipes]
MPPAIAGVQNGTVGNVKVIGKESKISYEAEGKRILSHSPIPSGMNGNITNSSNQLPPQSALHNQPSLQANVTRHALPVLPPQLAYEITDLIEKAGNKVSESQNQQTAPEGKGLSSCNEYVHKAMKYHTLKEIYSSDSEDKSLEGFMYLPIQVKENGWNYVAMYT